jgi:invasion protein IalB
MKERVMRIVRVVAISGLIAVLSSSAPAQTAAQQTQSVTPPSAAKPPVDAADMTTATYGDWLLRCRQAPGQTPSKSCEIVQSLVVQGQTAPIAQLAFGYTAPKQPLVFTAVVPVNVAFPSAVRVSIDDKDKVPLDATFTRCLPTGCFASAAMTDEMLTKWRTHDQAGRLTFKNGAGQETVVPMSFRGLARALEALTKESGAR